MFTSKFESLHKNTKLYQNINFILQTNKQYPYSKYNIKFDNKLKFITKISSIVRFIKTLHALHYPKSCFKCDNECSYDHSTLFHNTMAMDSIRECMKY